jgi:hypothetical protein
MSYNIDTKRRIIEAGKKAIDELVKIAEDKVSLGGVQADDDDGGVTADKLKNVAMTKKIAIFDAFEILSKIEQEEESIRISQSSTGASKVDNTQGFAERNSRKPVQGSSRLR